MALQEEEEEARGILRGGGVHQPCDRSALHYLVREEPSVRAGGASVRVLQSTILRL